MNVIETIILFFSFQALVLGILFAIRKNGDRIANGIFSVFMLLFAYNLFLNVLIWSHFDMKFLAFLSYTYFIPISLYGTLFFLYIRRVTTGKDLSWRDTILLLPFLTIMVRFASFYVLPLEIKIEKLTTPGFGSEYLIYFTWGIPILVIIMLFFGLYAYFKFIHRYKQDPEMKIWLRVISIAFISFCFSHIAYRILVATRLITRPSDYFITFFMIALISIVCYFAFIHSSVFNGLPLNKAIPFIKYKKTGLSVEFSKEMNEKLQFLMDNQKPYLNPDIRLDKLASLLDVSRHHASQIINEHFSMNFFDFINQYRIKEAEHLLSSKPDLSITDIAFQSGFNNRISFYKAFKKIVGTTPSEYRAHNIAS